MTNEHDYEAALEAGRLAQATEFRAESVRYDLDRNMLEIMTTQGGGFVVPLEWVPVLANLTPADLAELDVWPDGSAIELDAHDIHISVHGLLTGLLSRLLPGGAVSHLFAERGGRSTSAAKQAAARENGRRGGRPRKASAIV